MSQIDASNGFLNKIELLQEKLRKSEEERLQLEAKFTLLMKSCKEEEEHRLHELRRQYENFLEEDKRRKERNKKILQTLERVESRAAILTAKSERLKLLREHYEAYLKRTYPTWKEKSASPNLNGSQNIMLYGIGSDRPLSTSQRNSFSFSDILPSSTPDYSRRPIDVTKEFGTRSYQSPSFEVKQISQQSSFSKPGDSSLIDCIERTAMVLKVDKDKLNEIYDLKQDNSVIYPSPLLKNYGILDSIEKEQNTIRDLFNVSDDRLRSRDISCNSNHANNSLINTESTHHDRNKSSLIHSYNHVEEEERIECLPLNDGTILKPLQDNVGDVIEGVKSPRKMYKGTSCIDDHSDKKSDILGSAIIADALDPTHVGEEIERVLSLDNKDTPIMKLENNGFKLGVIGEEEDQINELVSSPTGYIETEQLEGTLTSVSGEHENEELDKADVEPRMNITPSANSTITFQDVTPVTQVQTVPENFPLHNSQEYYVEYESVQDLQQAVYYQNVVEERYEDLPIYDQNMQSMYNTEEFNEPEQPQGEIYSQQIVYDDSLQQNPVYGDIMYEEDFDTSQVVYEHYPQQEQLIYDQNQHPYDNVYEQNVDSPPLMFEEVQKDQIMYEQSVDQNQVAYDENMHPAQVIYQSASPEPVIYQSDQVIYDDSLLSEQMMYNENVPGQHIVYTKDHVPVEIAHTDYQPEQSVNKASKQLDINSQNNHIHNLQEEANSSEMLSNDKIYVENFDNPASNSQKFQAEETNNNSNFYKNDIESPNTQAKIIDSLDNLYDITSSGDNEKDKTVLTASGINHVQEVLKEEVLEKVTDTISGPAKEDINEIGDHKKGSASTVKEESSLNEQLDKDDSFSEQGSFDGGKYHERTVAYEGSNVCVTADNSSEDSSERWSRLPSKVKPATVSMPLNLEHLHSPDDDTSEDSSEQWGVMPSEQLLEKSQKESSVANVKKTDVVQGKKLSRRTGVSKLPGLPRMPESDPESLQLDTDSSTTAD